MIHTPHTQTAYTLVLNLRNMDRMFISCPGANREFVVGDVRETHVTDIDLFHFGYPPLLETIYADGGEALAGLFANLHRSGVVTSLDLSMPDIHGKAGKVDWRSFLTRVLPHVDIFMPSLEEIMFMVRPDRFQEIQATGGAFTKSITDADLAYLGETLVDMGARIVGIKLGVQGLYLRTGDIDSGTGRDIMRPWWWQSLSQTDWQRRELYVPCFMVYVSGTTVAGDCTIAGFLYGILHGLSAELCMTYAVAVGAFSVEQEDSTSGIPSWAVVQERVRRGWERAKTAIPLKNWTIHDGVYHSQRDRKNARIVN
ncbi:MAG: carbohydrate kinase family protein [Alicyclobacillus herbarius]|uniref:carbohydrate kinase family protein n=1 Tax=Alicyclobacillus herbarius TaxID=122960 RepID=UPI0023559520|nr:carbohydrate kinase family protein [Alicyclobacillus herbarius]MCL6633665.1 carbohydrate kinase family protein [Alicyclobacillus herbarius]